MAKRISATVLQAMDWEGRSYPPGATVTLPVIDALTLKRQRLVSLTLKGKSAAAPEPAPPAAEPPAAAESKRRRHYRRRDLQAEGTPVVSDAAVLPIVPTSPAADAPTPQPDTPIPVETSPPHEYP